MRGFYRHGEGFREHQKEVAERDALRWGDAYTVTGVATVGTNVNLNSKQLVRAHVPRPIVWNVQLNIDVGGQVPAGETATLYVTFAITIGCGMSQTTIYQQIELLPGFGYEIPAAEPISPLTISAQDLQVIANLQYTPTIAGTYAIPLAAMAAPWAHLPFGEGKEHFAAEHLPEHHLPEHHRRR